MFPDTFYDIDLMRVNGCRAPWRFMSTPGPDVPRFGKVRPLDRSPWVRAGLERATLFGLAGFALGGWRACAAPRSNSAGEIAVGTVAGDSFREPRAGTRNPGTESVVERC